MLRTILGQAIASVSAPSGVGLAALALLGSGCAGPQTRIVNPDGHRVFVDGTAQQKQVLPFRYYGTSRWDAQPADEATGRPDWSRTVGSGAIPLPPPASPWLFPFDFALEAVCRLAVWRNDTIAVIDLPPTPTEQRVDAEAVPVGQRPLVERAHAARIAR